MLETFQTFKENEGERNYEILNENERTERIFVSIKHQRKRMTTYQPTNQQRWDRWVHVHHVGQRTHLAGNLNLCMNISVFIRVPSHVSGMHCVFARNDESDENAVSQDSQAIITGFGSSLKCTTRVIEQFLFIHLL